MNERTTKTKELILGFDAGCGKCIEIARRVRDRVGDRLSVRSLHDQDLSGWREEALGEDAPWAPTLFEVEDGRAQVWTGRRMALPLSRRLGLSATWQLMQALGDMPNAETLDYAGAATVGGMSRSRFLKGVGGATLAMGLMSGTGALTLPALAEDRRENPHDITKAWRPTRADTSEYIKRAKLNADARFVAGGALDNVTATPLVVRYRLRNGTIMTSVVFELAKAEQFLGVCVSTKPVGGQATSFSNLWLGDGTRLHDEKRPACGKKRLYKASAGQRPVTLAGAASRSYADDPLLAKGMTRSGSCPPISSGAAGSGCYRTLTRCVGKDLSCLVGSGVIGVGCWGAMIGAAFAVPATLGASAAIILSGIAGCGAITATFMNPDICCNVTETCRVPC